MENILKYYHEPDITIVEQTCGQSYSRLPLLQDKEREAL